MRECRTVRTAISDSFAAWAGLMRNSPDAKARVLPTQWMAFGGTFIPRRSTTRSGEENLLGAGQPGLAHTTIEAPPA
jgi:hypothetical protein